MKKIVKFTSGPPPVQQPTHWVNKNLGFVMWKVEGFWNALYLDGEAVDNLSLRLTPSNRPEDFEPRYGPLTITINFDEKE